jgi:hypothetical protein
MQTKTGLKLYKLIQYPQTEDTEVDVLVQGDTTRIRQITESAEGYFKYTYGNIAAVRIGIPGLRTLATSTFVTRMELPENNFQLMNDSMRSVTGVNAVFAGVPPLPQGYDGSGVVLGIIDSGVDLTHPDLQDSAGNIFILQATQTITTAGTYTFSFICSSVGATNPSIGSITQISTPIQGVASVTNNATASVIGTDYETDAQLRIRIAASRSFNSRDQLSSIKSRLLAVNGVTYAYVDHNRADITNSIGILPHSVACVVEGGLQSDIANAIALYSAPIGIATQGDIAYTITKSNGRTEIVSYSQTTITLCQVYISIYKDGGYANFDFIAESLASNLFFDIGQIISNDAIIKYVKSITNSDFIINTVQVAIDDETPIFLDRIIPTDYKTRFILQASKITIV